MRHLPSHQNVALPVGHDSNALIPYVLDLAENVAVGASIPDRSGFGNPGTNQGSTVPGGYSPFVRAFANLLAGDHLYIDAGNGASLALAESYDTTSLLFTAADGGQGLTSDGVNWYWGKDNGDGVNGSVCKLDGTGVVVATFTGPPHAAGADWRQNNDSLLFSSGAAEVPVVWEINKTTGAQVRVWDFTGTDYNRGALVAWLSGNTIYLFTSDASGNFKVRQVTIANDGTFTPGSLWSHATLGTPQDLEIINGNLYYLADYKSNVKGVFRLTLNGDGSISIAQAWLFSDAEEAEGLTVFGSDLYYGTALLKVRETNYPAQAARELSLLAWVNWHSNGGFNPVVISKGSLTDGNNPYVIYIENVTSTARFGITTIENGFKRVIGSALSLGTWYFLVMTYDGITLNAYINGTQQTPMETPGVLQELGGNVTIGCDTNAGVFREGLDGMIGHPRIAKVALSPSVIQTMFARERGFYGV